MRFHDTVSTALERARALDDLVAGAAERFEDGAPDLGLLFFTPHHLPEGREIAEEVRRRTGVRHLIGCTVESLIGAGREIEGRPALGLWLARVPGVGVRTFALSAEQTPEGFAFSGLPALEDEIGPARALIFLGDPFSVPVDLFLRNFDEDHPGIPIVGGMASGARGPGQNLLLIDDESHSTGAVGAVLTGALTMRTVVSQGCRPVGKHYVVTRSEENVIHEMGGRKAMDCLKEVFEGLSGDERTLFRHAPHLGCVIDEAKESFGPGDFLLRNLVWADPQGGSLAVGEIVRRGQTVQFHVRDGEAADADLDDLLGRVRKEAAEGALLFSCNGRGRRLFSVKDHDVSAVRRAMGEIPVGGFFAAGEIGPVGGRNFLHGFTASIALFSAP